MNEETMLNYLVESVNEAFIKSFNYPPEDLYFDNFDEIEEECVISSISFKGLLEGSCSISLPESSACGLVEKMLGCEIPEMSFDIIDGVGEMLNMIIGGIKMQLKDPKYYFDISVPTCVKGSRMVVLSSIKGAFTIIHNFKIDKIVFAVSLIYKINSSDGEKEKLKQQALDRLKNLGV